MKEVIAVAMLAFAAAVIVFLAHRGPSFRSQFEHAVAASLARGAGSATFTEDDLAAMPPAVQRYVRLSGAVGQPLVRNLHARFRGEIRSGPTARWMAFTGEQYNFYDEPSRFFIMDASMYGVPCQVLHMYAGPSVTMRVRLASLFTIVDAKGAEMDRAETVTLFNDMCIFAPAALVTAPVHWQEIDEHTVAARYTNAGHTIEATLRFNPAGELVDFVSGDRSVASPNGKEFTRMPWSTPVGDYRSYRPYRLAGRGEGRWHAPDGEYVYIRLQLEAVEYNVPARRSSTVLP